jgi:hypothetical protein
MGLDQLDVATLRQILRAELAPRADRGEQILGHLADVDIGLGPNHTNSLPNVTPAYILPAATARVELVENLAGDCDIRLRTHQANLVAARVRPDTELLLENLQRAIPRTVQLGGQQVVVEDEALPGLCLGARSVSRGSGCSSPGGRGSLFSGAGLVLGQRGLHALRARLDLGLELKLEPGVVALRLPLYRSGARRMIPLPRRA